MSLMINTTIPAAGNSPSNDQPLIMGNFVNINAFLGIDLVGPGKPGNGFHQQVTLYQENAPSGPPTDPTSIIYSAAGVASTIAELQYQNQNVTLPLSTVKAYALCSVAGIVSSQSFNVTSVTRMGLTSTFNVVIPANVCTGLNYGVMVSPMNNSLALSYQVTITGATTFSITFTISATGAQSIPTNFAFQVIQV